MENNNNIEIQQSDLEAMRIYNMVNGNTQKSAAANPELSEEDIDRLIDEALATGNKKEKKAKAKSKVKNGSDNQTADIVTEQRLPECSFASLKPRSWVQVYFAAHSIPYKDQDWKIPERYVKYKIALVTKPIVAQGIAENIHRNDPDIQNKAYNGEVRYYTIDSEESVAKEVQTIGFVEIKPVNGKVTMQVLLNKKAAEKYGAVSDDIRYSVHKEMKKLVRARKQEKVQG